VVDEEDPGAVREPAMDLHPVMVDLKAFAGIVNGSDRPLRTRQCEIASHCGVVHHHVHVWLHPDVRGHRFADAAGAS
jgi:hypothetical protein